MSKIKMKNVLIIRNAYKYDFGGAEMHALNLSISLKKQGFRPILVTRVPILLERSAENKIETIKGIWYSNQGWGRFYKFFGWFLVLWYLFILKIKHIDVLHAHSRDDFVFATTAAKILKIKTVWTDHADLKYVMEKHNSPDLRGRIVELARYASRVIAVSNSEKSEILERYKFFPNLEVINNGVFLPKTINKIDKPKKIIIGVTNRLVTSKGIGELIEAYSKIKKLYETQLWIVGDGPEKEKFIDLARALRIGENVKFLGYQRDVWRYLYAFDIYIQPTYHEAFSNSLIEASMAGCAVIATETGGNPEIINTKNGILVPVKDSEAITKAIDSYISNPADMKRKSTLLKKYAIKNYNFDKIVKEKVIPIYEN